MLRRAAQTYEYLALARNPFYGRDQFIGPEQRFQRRWQGDLSRQGSALGFTWCKGALEGMSPALPESTYSWRILPECQGKTEKPIEVAHKEITIKSILFHNCKAWQAADSHRSAELLASLSWINYLVLEKWFLQYIDFRSLPQSVPTSAFILPCSWILNLAAKLSSPLSP